MEQLYRRALQGDPRALNSREHPLLRAMGLAAGFSLDTVQVEDVSCDDPWAVVLAHHEIRSGVIGFDGRPAKRWQS
ncbi:MAG: hypothetical protein AAFQ82_02065, partial [Myxococcota bacterium]